MTSSSATGTTVLHASDLNNRALELEASGNYIGAEKLHLEALRATGEKSIGVALTKNALGELYMTMDKLDDAQRYLEEAAEIRGPINDFDAFATYDNLGRVHEMRGDFSLAREMREKGAPSKMICSYFHCNRSSACQLSVKDDLMTCARCKCVLYCSRMCQEGDWWRHKKYCKSTEVA